MAKSPEDRERLRLYMASRRAGNPAARLRDRQINAACDRAKTALKDRHLSEYRELYRAILAEMTDA